jgi:hypothetical protein
MNNLSLKCGTYSYKIDLQIRMWCQHLIWIQLTLLHLCHHYKNCKSVCARTKSGLYG